MISNVEKGWGECGSFVKVKKRLVIDFLDENDRNDDRKFEEQALIY
jgi:hypothetical protein